MLFALGTGIFSYASSVNYPGGHAMELLHTMHSGSPGASIPAYVHIGNLAATTGVSRFGEVNPYWTYSKEEGLDATDIQKRPITQLISEFENVESYKSVASVYGYSGVSINRNLSLSYTLPFIVHTSPQLWIHIRTANFASARNP